MAWNKESTAARRARVAKQLRDKHGKWIEMGGGVKWFDNGSWHNGTASAFEGNNVVVKMDDGSEKRVNHRQIEPIRAKGSLGDKPAKPTGSVKAKKSRDSNQRESAVIKDNDPSKRLTTNAADLEEGDEVHLLGGKTPKYGLTDREAASQEDKGFEVALDDDKNPIRARVVDTNGSSVTVEDSAGKRHKISKKSNVLADDPEVDAAIQNRESGNKSLSEVSPEELRAMPKGTELHYKDSKSASSFRKDGADAWQRVDADGNNVGKPADSAFLLQNLGNKDDMEVLSKKDAEEANRERAAAAKESRENPSTADEAPKADIEEEDSGDDADDKSGIDLEGLDLSDEDKAHINAAETGEEALKRLTQSDAGQYLPIARQNKNKAFVDAYRKAVNDINDKHKVVDSETPAEATKPEGTPLSAIEKSAANLSEDIADIKSQNLEGDAKDSALGEAVYDVKNDAGEEFLLSPKHDEENDSWQLDVTDSSGKVVDTLPLEDQKPQDFAQAIKNSIEKKSSSDESEAPTEAPEDSDKEQDAPKADLEEDDSSAGEPGSREHLDKALKDAGFSDSDIEAIAEAAKTDESEADKQFFQSESGRKANDENTARGIRKNGDDGDAEAGAKYKEARKALDDFLKANNDSVKSANDKSDQTRQDSADEKARADEFDSPEARAQRAEETIDSGRERDAARAAKNTDEAKLAELDRKIGVGEKMLKDAEAKENAPLVQRLSENIAALKKQRDALAPKNDEDSNSPEAEEAPKSGSTPGTQFDSPEGGVPILSNKKLERTQADRLKNGDRFLAQLDSKGKIQPIQGNDLRAHPDGESYEVVGVNKGTSKLGITAKDSKGKLHLFEYGVGDRKSNIIHDSEKNRELLGLTEKSKETEAPKEAEGDRTPAPRSAKAPLSQEMLDNLPDGSRVYAQKAFFTKKDGEWFKDKSESKGPVDVPDTAKLYGTRTGDMIFKPFSGEISSLKPQDIVSATMADGMEARVIVDSVKVKDGKIIGRVMGGSLNDVLQDIATDRIQSVHRLHDDGTYYANEKSPKSDNDEIEKEAPSDEDMGEEVAPAEESIESDELSEVTDEDIASVMQGLEANEEKLKVETTDQLVAQLRGGSLPDGRSVHLVKDENGNLAWEAREKDGTPLGQVPYMDEKRFVDKDKRNAALRDLFNGNSNSDDVPAEKDPEEEKLADDFIAENPEETQDAPEGPTPDEVESMVEEALADIDDDLEEFGGDANWQDISLREWPIIRDEKATGFYIAAGTRSTDEDRFLGLYDSNNEELETFDMEGKSLSGTENRNTDDTGAGDVRGDDSAGGAVPEGDGPDSGAGNSDGESSSGDSVDPAEFDSKVQSLVDQVKADDGEAEGASVLLGDGYSAEYDTNQNGTGIYRLRDGDGQSLVTLNRTNEDRMGEILRAYVDSHKVLNKAFASDKDSDGRNVKPNRQMAKLASIGTIFDDGKNRYTKISPISWRVSKSGDDSTNGSVIDGHDKIPPGNYRLSHYADNHRSLDEIDKMSDDELRQHIKEFEDQIHGIIETDGKLGDKQGGSYAQGVRDQQAMAQFRYEAYRISDEANDYAQKLWERLRDNGAHTDGDIPTGEFNSSREIPFTNKDASIDENSWMGVRNEYVGLDHRTIKHNFELRNSEKPSRAAVAWANKMDKWARSGELADDFSMYRSVLASPDAATEFSPGNVVTDKGIVSLADNQHTAEVYLGNRAARTAGKIPIVMEVQGRKGEKMTAAGGGSDELVVPRGSRLFISSAKLDDEGILRVVARLNPSEAEIAEWTNKSSSDKGNTPEAAPVAPEATPEPKGIPAKDPDNPVNGEDGFQPHDGSGLKGKPSGRFTQVEGFKNGDRVFHAKHGAGTIIKREGNGQYARIQFDKDKDSGKVMGISLTKVSLGESAPEAAEAPKSPAKSITPKPTTVKAGSTAETEGWNVGERVNHGKHGMGTVKRLEGNGEYARVEFDGAAGLKGIKLSQLGRGDNASAPSKPAKSEKPAKTPRTPKAPLATAPEGSPGQIGGWTLGDKLTHRSKGSGTLKSFGKDGTFGMVEFDSEPGVQRGIRFSGLTKTEPSSSGDMIDPSTKVNGEDGNPVNSGDTDTRESGDDPSTSVPVLDKDGAELYVGAVVIHPQLGRGRVVKLGLNGKNIQVIFDNDPTGKPKSLTGARLKDIAIAPASAKDKTSL